MILRPFYYFDTGCAAYLFAFNRGHREVDALV